MNNEIEDHDLFEKATEETAPELGISRVFGPVPNDSGGGVFRMVFSPDEVITKIWVGFKGSHRIRRIVIKTNKGQHRSFGAPNDYRTLKYYDLIGPIVRFGAQGGNSPNLGPRVTAIHLMNDLNQNINRGWDNSEKFFKTLHPGEYISAIFGRSGADIDQIGIEIKSK